MFGGKKSTDEWYKTNEHSNVVTFVRALVSTYIATYYITSTQARENTQSQSNFITKWEYLKSNDTLNLVIFL